MLRELIDQDAALSDLEKKLDKNCFFSFKKYGRFLLEEGLVVPERIEEIFFRTPTVGFSEPVVVKAITESISEVNRKKGKALIGR